MHENEALGLPPGSVRAILAISIIPLTVLGSITLMCLMFWKGEYTSALGILSGLTGMSGAVVGYYFGSKASNKATDEIIKVHKDISDTQKNLIDRGQEMIASRDRELNRLVVERMV